MLSACLVFSENFLRIRRHMSGQTAIPRLRYTFAHGGNFPCFSIDVNSFLCIGLEEVVQIFRGP